MPERPQAALRLEPHMIPALRAAFADALDQLAPQLRRFTQDAYIAEPWMGDPISQAIAMEHNARAVGGGADSAYECLLAYEAELVKVRDALAQMEAEYRRTEGDNAALWGRV